VPERDVERRDGLVTPNPPHKHPKKKRRARVRVASASAITIRWRWPPENWWEAARVIRAEPYCARRADNRALEGPSGGTMRRTMSGSAIAAHLVARGLSDSVGYWKIICNRMRTRVRVLRVARDL